MVKFLAAIVLISPICVASDSFKEFSAEYNIGGATLVDSPDLENKNSHIYFRFKDSAAKDMYEMIETAPVRDECLDDGTLTKRAKNIECSFNPSRRTYSCYFSIDVNSNAIGLGVVC